jgi:hypothetical protein
MGINKSSTLRRNMNGVTIVIYSTATDADAMASLLKHIAVLIEEGYTSGFHPAWRLEDDNEVKMDSGTGGLNVSGHVSI